MVRQGDRRSRVLRLVVLGGMLVSLVVLALALVAGSGPAGAARGTSEVVGYYGTVQVKAQAVAPAVALGQTQTVLVHTAPNAHIAYTVTFTGSKITLTGKGQANAAGLVTITFLVAVGPPANGRPLLGMVLVHATDPGVVSSSLVTFKVFPALHLKTRVQVAQSGGSTQVRVTVSLAVASKVTASVTLTGAKKPAATAQTTTGGSQPVTLTLSLGGIQGKVTGTVTVTVVTVNGVTDTHSSALPAQQ